MDFFSLSQFPSLFFYLLNESELNASGYGYGVWNHNLHFDSNASVLVSIPDVLTKKKKKILCSVCFLGIISWNTKFSSVTNVSLLLCKKNSSRLVCWLVGSFVVCLPFGFFPLNNLL